ncbi:MAG: VWA domain-containing protein [Terriglobales bacterium]
MTALRTVMGMALVPVLVLAAAQAQGAPALPAQQTPYVFHANVGEVLVHATVVNKKDQPVTNLPQPDFTIYENGVPQRIEYFAHEDAPVSVGILVDNSGSMKDSRPEVNRAALNFVKASNQQDEVFIVNFNDEYYLDAAFTNNISKLQDALDHIESSGGTALYDATIASLDYMNNNARNDKHVMLVITDGDDDESSYTLEETVRLLQTKNSPLLYCIGIMDKDNTRSMTHQAERALKALAQATGGAAYFPRDLQQVNAITLAVAKEIRSQYSFAYHSNQTGAGFRAIRVEVEDKHQKHLTVHARNGYYANAPSPAAGGGSR